MPDMQSALRARFLADAALSAITPRVHWTIVPEGAALPYIRLQTVSDPRPEHLTGYDSTRQTRVQVDCFASTYSTARTLAEAVIAAVAQPANVSGVIFGRTRADGPRDLGEDTSKGFVHRLSVDLLVEHSLA